MDKNRRILRQTEPMETIAKLNCRAEGLRGEIDELLDQLVAADRENYPGVPEGVLRSARQARHFYGWCPCAWVEAEAERLDGNKQTEEANE